MDTKGRKLFRYVAGILTIAVLMGAAYTTTVMASGIGLIDTANLLDIHAEADDSSAVVGQVMDEGHVAILGRCDGWVQIQAGEIVGWVPEENLIETDVSNEEAVESNERVIEAFVEDTADEPEIETVNAEEMVPEEMTADAPNESIADQEPVEDGEVQLPQAQAEAEAQLEAQAAAEAQRQAEEQAAASREILAAAGVTEEELCLLANIIYCEAKGEPYIGKVAVGNVVMNRVKSEAYPDSITEVIYAKGQFSPVRNGSMEKALKRGSADASCYQAALEALAGSSPVGDKLYFRRVNGRSGQVIGHHVFY
ncbi:MAG: cell wall hydrolase [Eubacteriales bacterium]|nr:cell wall hydrolase [Eubacteriales bacterium]